MNQAINWTRKTVQLQQRNGTRFNELTSSGGAGPGASGYAIIAASTREIIAIRFWNPPEIVDSSHHHHTKYYYCGAFQPIDRGRNCERHTLARTPYGVVYVSPGIQIKLPGLSGNQWRPDQLPEQWLVFFLTLCPSLGPRVGLSLPGLFLPQASISLIPSKAKKRGIYYFILSVGEIRW